METLKRVCQPPNPFRVQEKFRFSTPGLSLRSNPGLQLANAFGVWAQISERLRRYESLFNLNQYLTLLVLGPWNMK